MTEKITRVAARISKVVQFLTITPCLRMHVASIICRGTLGYFLREILLSTRIGLSLVSEQWGWSWNRAAG
jgi:hypothetical protein